MLHVSDIQVHLLYRQLYVDDKIKDQRRAEKSCQTRVVPARESCKARCAGGLRCSTVIGHRGKKCIDNCTALRLETNRLRKDVSVESSPSRNASSRHCE